MSATALQELMDEEAPKELSLIEPACNTGAYFSGVRMHIVNGMTHLLFYSEQPSTDGDIEYMVVARMVGTNASFKASLDRFAGQFRRPMSSLTPGRPLN
jgi:hypothetical protein